MIILLVIVDVVDNVTMFRKIIICVTNDLSTDQRVHKVALTLVNKADFEVILVGRKLKTSPELDRIYAIHRFRLWINSGPLFYLFYNIRLLFYLLFNSFNVLLSNDLDTLPACKIAAKIKNRQVVFDSHELFTEVPELVNRPQVKKVWECIEKAFVKGLKHCYTVCEPIANIYKQQYGVDMQVVRNVPHKQAVLNEEKFEMPTIIYQGALNVGRGIELMIHVMQHLPDFELIICGKGDLEKKLRTLVADNKIANVQFKGHQSFAALAKITSQSHIGLSWEENIGKNYYYALPNKLFDYIQARIPVLVSNLPTMRQIVDQYGVGEVLLNKEAEEIASQIRTIYANRHTFAEALNRAANELCWENEEHVLLEIFNQTV